MHQPKVRPRELVQRIIDGRGFKFQDLDDYSRDHLGEAIRLLNHHAERVKLEQKLLSQERDRQRDGVTTLGA